jgi:hypothetical protein
MRTIQVNIYKFEELPEEVQASVLDDLSDINTDNEWYDGEFDYWKEKLEEFGFMSPEIFFSGFCSQGDGACFKCKSINMERAWKFFKIDMAKRNNWIHSKLQVHEAWLYDYLYNYVTFEVRCINSRYNHENSYAVYAYCHKPTSGYLNKFLTEFENWLEEHRRGLCMEIYRNLEDEYEHLTSEDAVKETILANDYEFYENGKLI